MKKTLIIIDAGHGGQDATGRYTTPAVNGKFWEHSFPCHLGHKFLEGVFNRQMAYLVAGKLQNLGFQAALVFDPVEDNSLTDRTNKERLAAGKWQGPSIFLSFHANSANQSARGLTLWNYPGSTAGRKLAEALAPLENLFKLWGSSRSTIHYEKGFHVLRYSASPACLLELGFFDNAQDAKLLLNPKFREDVASNIARLLDKNYS